MGDVQEAAIALFAEGFQEFEEVHLSWPNEHTCYVLRRGGDGSTCLADLYFHADNAILDLAKDVSDGTGWKRFQYADPAYPHNLIELLYRRCLDWLRDVYRLGDALGAGAAAHLQKTEQAVHLLLAENQRLHLGLDDGRPGVLVVSGH